MQAEINIWGENVKIKGQESELQRKLNIAKRQCLLAEAPCSIKKVRKEAYKDWIFHTQLKFCISWRVMLHSQTRTINIMKNACL